MKNTVGSKTFLKSKRLVIFSLAALLFIFGALLVTKSVKAAQNVITHYSAPAGANVYSVATDSTGNGWFLFGYGGGSLGNPTPQPDTFLHLGRIDATTGAFTQFTVGTATIGGNTHITAAADNSIYITITSSGYPTPDYISKVAKFNPTNNQFTFYPVNAVGGSSYTLPERIIEGPDNNIWFIEAGASRVTKMNPSNGTMTNYSDPDASSTGGNYIRPVTLVAGPDGDIWIGRVNSGITNQKKIAKIDISSGAYTSYNIAEFTSNIFPANTNNAISVASLDGSIWISSAGKDQLRKINPADGTVQATYTFGAPYYGLGLLNGGANHTLWFLSSQSNRGILGKFDATTNEFSVFAGTQTAGDANTTARTTSLAVSPDGNKVWYGKWDEAKVGLLTVDDTITPPPPEPEDPDDPDDPDDPEDPDDPNTPNTPNGPSTPTTILSPKTGVIGGLIIVLIASGATAGIIYDRDRRARVDSKNKSEK